VGAGADRAADGLGGHVAVIRQGEIGGMEPRAQILKFGPGLHDGAATRAVGGYDAAETRQVDDDAVCDDEFAGGVAGPGDAQGSACLARETNECA
jgi:hypothetical protein